MGRPYHNFNPTMAEQYGVDVAVFLNNIFHWVQYNRAHKKNFFEGRYWTYNSISAFCEVHPYWSKRQIERITASCRKEGLLLTGCFNEDQRDRTMWYTLSDLAMAFFEDRGETEMADCISPSGEMQSPEPCQSFPQTVAPLPIKKPDKKQQEDPLPPEGGSAPEKDKPKRRRRAPKSVPSWMPERFEGFWAAYPRDEDRAKAVEQWDKLPQDRELMERYGSEDALLHDIALGLKIHLECEDWREGRGIPYAFRWLRDRRWLEKRKTVRPAPEARPARVVDSGEVPVW